MKKPIQPFLSCFIVTAGLALSVSAEPAQLMISFKLLEAPEAWIDQHKLNHPPHEIREQLFKTGMQEKGISLLSAPKILTLENQEARIEIKDDTLEYLEKTDDGYQPRKMADKEAPGLSLTVKGSRVENGQPGEIRLEWNASIVTVGERLPVPGINLDVGKPVVSAQEVTSVVEVFDGKWWLLSKLAALEKNGKNPVLIFAQVTEVKPKGDLADPEIPQDLQADKTSFDAKTGAIRASGNVRLNSGNVTILAEALTLDPKATSGASIQADQVVFLDNPAGRMRLDGNVRLRTDAGLISADSLVVDRASLAEKAEESALEKKLKSIILPQLDFQNAQIEDALDFFRAVAKNADPKGQGINILYKPRPGQKDLAVSMSLSQIPLYDAIRYLTEIGNLSYRITDTAVMVE